MPLKLLWLGRVRTDVDVGTAYLDLQPSGVELGVYVDDGSVYLDIQPGQIFLQVDFLLEIVGIHKRWSTEAALQRALIVGITRRWQTVESFARWAIMETRRLLWKF
jgi:hypothetical protein